MKSNLVSIITPTFNSEKYISQTIQSIQAQTYNNWELLITDDCSTDGTIDVIKSYQKRDSRIKLFFSETNLGAGAARNRSIKEARGRYIAFCDSDDQWKKINSKNNYLL
jgi:teichuronic acid biosynthesis glycosyltransferase TuaG